MVAGIPNLFDWSTNRLQALKELVRHATPDDPRPLYTGDLGNRQDVVDYGASADRMWRYTHMYGAKHPCGWSVARAGLNWSDEQDRPLVVLGAGSLLCAAGWTLFDECPREVHAFDVLDWSPVLDSTPGRRLQASLGRVRRHSGVFCPMTASRTPAQLAHLRGLRALQPTDIPRGSTVIMSMMLNHLLEGGRLPDDTRKDLDITFRLLRYRRCRVVIADLASRTTTRLWKDIEELTDTSAAASLLDLSEPIQLFQQLFTPPHRAYRTFQRYPTGARLRMLAWDGRKWTGV